MKWTTWILFALSIGLALAVIAMVSRQARTTPSQFFAAVEKRIADGRYDREQTLQNLEQVLARARAEHDSDLVARVELRRGRMLMEMGAFERARADLLAVAAERPGDRAVEDDLVELEARSGDFHGAEERVTRILQRNPRDAAACVALGRLHRQAADKTTAAARETLTKVLVAEDGAKAAKLVARSAALDLADPRRVAIGFSLRELLRGAADERTLEEVLKQLDQASRDLHDAREAYARSLDLGLTSEALAGLIDLYERAGLTPQAVDLATSTLRVESVRADPELGRLLLHGFKELSRFQYGSDFATLWVNRSGHVKGSFLLDCCEVLWRARRWDGLHTAGEVLAGIGSPAESEAAVLYVGLSAAGRNDWAAVPGYLRPFVLAKDPEPFPGARAEAWRQLARASRALGQGLHEREAIEGTIAADPNIDGGLYLRLAELQMLSPHGGYRLPEARYAKGMSLLPTRTAKLLPRWHEIGALELSAIGMDLEAVRQDLVHDKIWTPSSDASPYELFRLAQIHFEAGDMLRAAAHVKRLLEAVPDFLPGLDLAFDIARTAGKKREMMDYALQRMRVGGRTDAITDVLKVLPILDLDPKDLLAMMRADPEHTGRLAIATTLAAHGERELALATLEKLGFDSLGDEGRLLGARLYLEKHACQQALELLKPIGRRLHSLPGGDDMFVDAALGAGAFEVLEACTRELARSGLAAERSGASEVPVANPHDKAGARASAADRETDERTGRTLQKTARLAMIDRLLARGAGDAAEPLLRALDAAPTTRGGDVVLRLAAIALGRGDAAGARSALQRAQAFDTQGGYEYMNLLTTAAERNFDDLRAAASGVSVTGTRTSPLLDAELALLEGHADTSLEALDAAVQGPYARDPAWGLTAVAAHALTSSSAPPKLSPYFGAHAVDDALLFLRGPAAPVSAPSDTARARDPREALVMLVALRGPLGAPYLRARLGETAPDTHGVIWTSWLRAQCALAANADAEAEDAVHELLARAPDFGPAWDLEERLARRAQKSPADITDLRIRRFAALREASGTEAERKIARASILEGQGNLPVALAVAHEACASDPDSLEAHTLVGDLSARMSDDKAAVLAYRDALQAGARSSSTSRAERDGITVKLLATLSRVRVAAPPVMTYLGIVALLQDVQTSNPDDPRIVIEQARCDLTRDLNNPSLDVALAYSRLDRFRAQHKGIPLERLARGSAQAWADFLNALDPDRAEAFLVNELELEPGVLAPWIAMAHVLEARGEQKAALEQLRIAAKLSPTSEVNREILRVSAESEILPEEIDAAVHDITAMDGRATPDPELLLTAARAFVNLGPRLQSRANQTLDELMDARKSSPEFAVRYGILFSVARLTRGKPEDLKVALEMLREIQPLVTDPYQQNFVLALQGLARTRPAL